MGDSLAAANGQSSGVPAMIGADERASIMGMFDDGPSSNAALDYVARTPGSGMSDTWSPPSRGQQYVDAFGGEATLTGKRAVNPDSVESLRQSDGTYRAEIRGGADSPLSEAAVASMRAENLSRAQTLAAQSATGGNDGSGTVTQSTVLGVGLPPLGAGGGRGFVNPASAGLSTQSAPA